MKNSFLGTLRRSQLRECQLKQLSILKEVDRICRKYNLIYWLDGGTLLGAIRHKGFIPWDDDLDIAMPSDDFEKFKKIVQKELPESLFFQTKETDPSTPHHFAKIRDLNSFFVEYGDDFTKPYQKGIYIDIFCFVDYPPFPKKILSFLSRNISKSISILEKKRSFDELKSVCEVPYFILKYILLYPIWYFCNLFKGGKYQSFQVRDNALGVVHRKEVIYPLVKGFFEEIEFPIPFDSDTYLKDQYKDYMVLPSEEKRQIHAIYIHANLNK